ncbi:MAG: hypothetical protein NT099_06250 [Candidatus Saganbacteria bacterium]|nr:hypothetical protein [Candidatus Saganbacteria bacterium]
MKYSQLRKKIRSPIFSRQDLRLSGEKIFPYQLSLWQKKGYLFKIRNGLYVFADQLACVLPEEIAFRLYSPSYISLEKALSVYGIIPEMVYGITSVTPKTTREFRNKFGDFTYRHIKSDLFFGYREDKDRKCLMAEPEKALLDYLYFNLSKIDPCEAIEEFRFNVKIIKKELSRAKLKKYLQLFNNRKMNQAIGAIFRGK